MIRTVTVTEGRLANASLFDDFGACTAEVSGGPHDGHILTIDTAKHNCGAFYESVECSCGAVYSWGRGSCHMHHSTPEDGDEGLGQIMTMAYDWRGL